MLLVPSLCRIWHPVPAGCRENNLTAGKRHMKVPEKGGVAQVRKNKFHGTCDPVHFVPALWLGGPCWGQLMSLHV